MAPKILFVFTSNDKLHNTDKKTGWYLPEAAHPYYTLKEAGFELVAASEKGGKPPLDQSSVDSFGEKDAESKKFLQDKETQQWLENSIPLSQIQPPANEYAAIFYPGGHGPLIGLPDDDHSQTLIRSFYESGRIVSAVCHAPAVLTNVKLSDGSYLVKGRKVTCFSNEEEEQSQMVDNCPFLVETRLGERGGEFQKGTPWTEKVVVDKDSQGRILITGANPQSGHQLAKEIVSLLKAQ